MPLVTDDGGSDITSYNLLMDDGLNGLLSSYSGDATNNSLTTEFTISNGIVKGRTYRFKYRVLNQIGWSDYSDMTYILAASVPEKPTTLTVLSTSDTTIQL